MSAQQILISFVYVMTLIRTTILNFGADDCIPSLVPVDWWYIVNDLKVTRLDNGQEIQVNNGDYRCDRSSGVGLII
jgi:hypothetical protein